MPIADFSSLPDASRLWIFGAAAPVDEVDAAKLLAAVDAFLLQWNAHGHPLTCGRDWRDERFIAVAVDQRTEGASGCSIDGLFRTLRGLEVAVGTSFVGGGLVFFRDQLGLVHALARDEFERLAVSGTVTPETRVFDTTLTTLGEYRAGFERAAGASWHAALLGAR